jgi:hypothetical protein
MEAGGAPLPPFALETGKVEPRSPGQIEFQPAPGWLERSVTVRSESGTGDSERMEATLRSKTERQDAGWVLTQQAEEVQVWRGSEKISDPLVTLATRFSVKNQVNADGGFVKLLNAEDARDAVRHTFSIQEAQALLPYFSPEALEEGARREWEARYRGLFGRVLPVGDVVLSVDGFATTTGKELVYVVARKLSGVATTNLGEAALFELSCLGDAKDPAVVAFFRASAKEVPPLDATVHCEGEQVIGLKPFLPLRSRLKIQATVEGTGEVVLEKTTAIAQVEDRRTP